MTKVQSTDAEKAFHQKITKNKMKTFQATESCYI